VVLELFREHRISTGKASELLGLSYREFLDLLHTKNIPVVTTPPRHSQVEIFSQNGFHPKTGERLRPITRDIVVKHEEQRRSPRDRGTGNWLPNLGNVSPRGLFWGLGGFLLLSTFVGPFVQEKAVAKAAWRSA
jgi:Uncharacterised protein family (UPF0175)